MKTISVIRLSILLWMFSLIFTSCENDITKATEEVQQLKSLTTTQAIVYCGTPTAVNFMAGQNILAGSVTVGNDENNLYVTYSTVDGWQISSTHLYVGACELIPLNKGGNPMIGKFPLSTTHLPRVTSYLYTIPLSQLPACMCIAAHADVVKVDSMGTVIQSETAWGQGNPMGGNSWAMKFNYCKQACTNDPPDPVVLCYQQETAWATGTRYTAVGNWATFTSYDGSAKTVTIFAGQTINAGSVTLSSASPSGVTLTINLANGWILKDIPESVKIQGYDSPPSGNPSPGLFTTYKGTSLTVTVPYYSYYGIHLDVRKVIPCTN